LTVGRANMKFEWEYITSFREMGEIYLVDRNVIYIAVDDPVIIGPLITRLSEFQESPEFAGKYFTLDEYKDWYTKQSGNEEFTYATDWCGWNVSSDTIDKFYKLFDDGKSGRFLNTVEMLLRDVLLWFQANYDLPKYYLIVTMGDSIKKAIENGGKIDGLFKHEFKHAQFFLDDEYRDIVLAEWKRNRSAANLDTMVGGLGYNTNDPMLVIDESNAYHGSSKANEYFANKYLMKI
jgi:hypothetical protein